MQSRSVPLSFLAYELREQDVKHQAKLLSLEYARCLRLSKETRIISLNYQEQAQLTPYFVAKSHITLIFFPCKPLIGPNDYRDEAKIKLQSGKEKGSTRI